jgi:hypothetical protein
MRRNASTGREAWTFGGRRFPSVHLHLNRQARTDQYPEARLRAAQLPDGALWKAENEVSSPRRRVR